MIYSIIRTNSLGTKGVTVGSGDLAFNKVSMLKPMEFSIISQNKEFCKATSTINNGNLDYLCTFSDGTQYTLTYIVENDTIGHVKGLFEMAKELKEGNVISALGSFSFPKIKNSVEQEVADYGVGKTEDNVSYSTFTIEGKNFKIFDTGCEGDYNYYYIYDDNNQVVAAIEYIMRTMNYYVFDNSVEKYITLLALATQIGNLKEDNPRGKSNLLNSNAKAYARYDLVTNMKENTNPEYLVENMTLVKEMKQKYKDNTKGTRVFAISFILILILLIAAIIIFGK